MRVEVLAGALIEELPAELAVAVLAVLEVRVRLLSDASRPGDLVPSPRTDAALGWVATGRGNADCGVC